MSGRVSRGPSGRASGRKRRGLPLDLNDPPTVHYEPVVTSGAQSSQAAHIALGSALIPAPIDVDAIDDDIAILSPRAFEEAKNKARRVDARRVDPRSVSAGSVGAGRVSVGTIGVMLVVHSDAETSTARYGNGYGNGKRPRVMEPNQPVIDCESYVDLASNVEREGSVRPNVMPPPPPPLPAFSCPICMNPFTEEMSTKCGHIFCKGCIKTAITVQKKCPTCRRKLTMKDVIRIYLPSTT